MSRRICCLLFVISTGLYADQLATWNGGSGTWSDPTAWSIGSVPNNSANLSYSVSINSGTVMINSGQGTYDNPQPITINSLTNGGTIKSDGTYPPQTLNVNGNLYNSGIISMDVYWPALNVGGTMTNSGSVTAQRLAVAGDFLNTGSVTLPGGINVPSLNVTGTFNNAGALIIGSFNQGGASASVGQLSGNGTLSLGQSTLNLTNQPLGITTINGFMELDQGSNILTSSGSGFANLTSVNGSLYLYRDGPFVISPISSNHILSINGSVSLSDGSALSVNGNVLINGTLQFGDDERNFGGSNLTATGTITNNGTVYSGGSFSSGDPIHALTIINNGSINASQFSKVSAQSLINSGRITSTGIHNAILLGTGNVATQFSGLQIFGDGELDEIINGSSTFGQIHTSGAADLSGTLDITLGSDYAVTPGTSFTILTFTPGELSGAFSDVVYDSADPFSITYDNYDGDVYITALPVSLAPEPNYLLICVAVVGAIFTARHWNLLRLY